MKNPIWILIAGLRLLLMDESQARELTESHTNTAESHIDADGCTVTTETEYVDSAYPLLRLTVSIPFEPPKVDNE